MIGYYAYFRYLEPHAPDWLHNWAELLWRHFHDHHYLEALLPASLRSKVREASERRPSRLFLWRIEPLPTRLLGRSWPRGRDRVSIDITYSCNLRCYNCNRSCEQDPSNDNMSLEQVHHFLEESRASRAQWKRISVAGGEPTNHPQILEIMNLVLAYRSRYFPKARVLLKTNGYGERVDRVLSLLPPGVQVMNSAKNAKVQGRFQTFNVAPIDVEGYEGADFSNACYVTWVCGLGVTPYGYYPCAVAGAIDRTFGLDLGRKTLPEPDDPMITELRTFCRLCGHFRPPTGKRLSGPVMSSTWVQAYARSRQNPPTLSRLAESPALAQIGRERGNSHCFLWPD
jgi:hypothetical protein